MILGAHVSTSGKLENAIKNGELIGCEAIQIFTSNPKGWNFQSRNEEEFNNFLKLKEKSGIKKVFGHLIYLANLASNNPYIQTNSINSLISGLVLAQKIQADGVVMHIGSHGGRGSEEGLKTVVESLKQVLKTVGESVPILLETDSGAGNHLGAKFEDLKFIIDQVQSPAIKVCLDTCHSFAAGYDFSSPEGLKKTLQEFDKVIGLSKLALIHLNDSKGTLGSKLDRHEEIGKGEIGLKAFELIVNDPRLTNICGIVETPDNKSTLVIEELSLTTLKNLRK